MKYIMLLIIILLSATACTQTQVQEERVIHTPGLRDSQPLPEPVITQENVSEQKPVIIKPQPQSLEEKQLTIETKDTTLSYMVQVADESHEQRIGLMFQDHMDDDKGMIFLFNFEGTQGFWMKNTLIPLDIIFIDRDWKILNVAQAQPCKVDPCPLHYSAGSAKYVLELNLGQTEKNNIKTGDSVELAE